MCSRRNRPQFVVCCVYPVYPYLGQLSASPNGWLVGLLYYCGYHVCLTLGDPGRFRWFTSCKTKLKAAQPLVIVVGSIVQFDEAWKTYATTASFVVFFILAHPHVSGSNIAKSRCPNLLHHGQLHFFEFKHYGSAPPHFG